MGGFLYATLQTKLIELLGVSGCLLIVGAVSLNIIACAGPMRPLTPPKYYLKQRAALLEKAEAARLSEKPGTDEAPANQKPLLTKDAVQLTVEMKEPFQRRRARDCADLLRQIKSRLRDYSRYAAGHSCNVTHDPRHTYEPLPLDGEEHVEPVDLTVWQRSLVQFTLSVFQ